MSTSSTKTKSTKNGRFSSSSTHSCIFCDRPFSNVSRDPAVSSSCAWPRHKDAHTHSHATVVAILAIWSSRKPRLLLLPFVLLLRLPEGIVFRTAITNQSSATDCEDVTQKHTLSVSKLFIYKIKLPFFICFPCLRPSYYLLTILTTPTLARVELKTHLYSNTHTNNQCYQWLRQMRGKQTINTEKTKQILNTTQLYYLFTIPH